MDARPPLAYFRVRADSRTLVVLRPEWPVLVYDLAAGTERALDPVAGTVYQIHALPDGTTMVGTVSVQVVGDAVASPMLRWWSYPDFAVLQSDPDIGYSGEPLRVAADGSLVALAAGPLVRLYDGRTREFLGTLGDASRRHVQALAVSADGRRVLTGGRDKTVRLWDVPARRPTARWDFGVGTINDVAFSSDGLMAAVAGSNKLAVVWDLDV